MPIKSEIQDAHTALHPSHRQEPAAAAAAAALLAVQLSGSSATALPIPPALLSPIVPAGGRARPASRLTGAARPQRPRWTRTIGSWPGTATERPKWSLRILITTIKLLHKSKTRSCRASHRSSKANKRRSRLRPPFRQIAMCSQNPNLRRQQRLSSLRPASPSSLTRQSAVEQTVASLSLLALRRAGPV